MHVCIYMYICIYGDLFVCLGIEIVIHVCVDVYTEMYTYIYTYKHMYIYTCIPVYMYISIHVYTYTYIYTCIHANIHVDIHVDIHIYMHTKIFACIHAYIHVYIYTCQGSPQYATPSNCSTLKPSKCPQSIAAAHTQAWTDLQLAKAEETCAPTCQTGVHRRWNVFTAGPFCLSLSSIGIRSDHVRPRNRLGHSCFKS